MKNNFIQDCFSFRIKNNYFRKVAKTCLVILKILLLKIYNEVTSSIIIMSCHLNGYPWPSLATSPYHSSLLAGLQGYIPYPHIPAVCMFELVVLLLLGHMSTSLMSSSLLLQQCPACLVCLTCIVFMMGGKWPYSWCLVECCNQDLFKAVIVNIKDKSSLKECELYFLDYLKKLILFCEKIWVLLRNILDLSGWHLRFIYLNIGRGCSDRL